MSNAPAEAPIPAPSAKTVVLVAGQTVEEAIVTILRSNFELMRDWVPVAMAGEDIEGVHQMRVALRRLRSALNIFRRAIPRTLSDPWGEEMRWVANSLGPARDRDVFIAETLEPMSGKIPLAAGEQRMAELARQHRDAAYDHLREMLASDRYRAFAEGFPQWYDSRGWRQGEWGEFSQEPLQGKITKYAAKVMTKRMVRVLADGARISEMSAEELHMLRIDCKKLRYATEFFTALFDRQGMARFTLALKELQGLLGTLNDVAVLPSVLHQLIELDSSAPVVEYAGAMIGWRAREALDVRSQLTAKWPGFASTPQPWVETPISRRIKEKEQDKDKNKHKK